MRLDSEVTVAANDDPRRADRIAQHMKTKREEGGGDGRAIHDTNARMSQQPRKPVETAETHPGGERSEDGSF